MVSSYGMAQDAAPLAIYYEHPAWFERLFSALEQRGLVYIKIFVPEHVMDPSVPPLDAEAIAFNRMSASAHTRGHADTLAYMADLLTDLELRGIPVINGTRAYAFETSKAKQLALLASLRLAFPRSRVIHRADQVGGAARELRFPLVFKPNVGGRGTGIVRFDDLASLCDAAASGTLDFGMDSVALLQEYAPKRGDKITRVEILGGKFLYAIDVRTSAETFDLCPADVCAVPAAHGEDELNARVVTVTATKAEPPAEAIADVERICQAAGIEVGGVEYLVDDRDGRRLYYDVNALSNFVARPLETIGFDPWEPLVDWLETRVRERGLAHA